MKISEDGTIIKTIVRNHFNYKLHPSLPRPLTKPSCTIPDQVLSIEEILRRYARDPTSIPPANPVFDSPYPDLSRMDRLDKMQTAMDIKENIADYEEAVKTEKAAQEKAAKLKASKEATTPKTEPAPAPQEATPPPSTT